MDDLKERLYDASRFLAAWFEFGTMLVQATYMIPLLSVVAIMLLILPIAYLIFAFQQPLPVALFMFAVFGGCAAYSVRRFTMSDGSDRSHTRGRRILSERSAMQRATSRLQLPRRSNRGGR